MARIPYCHVEENAFDNDACRTLATQVQASALLARSQLDFMFKESQGFGVAFSSAHLAQVKASHPFFAPFLDRVLRKDAFVPLLSRREQLSLRNRLFNKVSPATPPPAANAWYANVLLVDKGASVGAHFDGTLGYLLDEEGMMPSLVSVLYLQVPERDDEGGAYELLSLAGRVLKKIQPKVGMLVEFDGRARHRVCAAQSRRLSMVVEQYVLSDEQFEKMHEPRFQSRAMDPAFRHFGEKRSFADLMRQKKG